MREIEDCRCGRDLSDFGSCEARDRDERRLLFIVLWSSLASPRFASNHEHERSSRIHIRVPDASVFVPHMFQLSLSVPSFFPL